MGGFNPQVSWRAMRALNFLRPDVQIFNPKGSTAPEVRGYEEDDDVEITSDDEAIRILEEELAELKRNRAGS